MYIDVNTANSQASTLSGYATTLRDLANGLIQFKSNVGSVWKSDEVNYLNDAIDRITKDLNTASGQLVLLGSDISSVAAEIQFEEEERRAAEARAEQARQAAIMEAAMRNVYGGSK